MLGLDLKDAPRDGRMTWLLVDYSAEDAHHPLADASRAWTIGFNNCDNDGEDAWRFAGWCWQQDHFTQGHGEVVAWLPTALNIDADDENGALAPSRNAVLDVVRERHRQVEVEGWSPDHDDEHKCGELALAAAAYASTAAGRMDGSVAVLSMANKLWPWRWAWWKPGDPRRMLVKAGALIIAEIERLDRRVGRA